MLKSELRNPVRDGISECTWSLASAIQEAGGRLRPDMMEMTLKEFITQVAGQNYIRFVCDRPDKPSSDIE